VRPQTKELWFLCCCVCRLIDSLIDEWFDSLRLVDWSRNCFCWFEWFAQSMKTQCTLSVNGHGLPMHHLLCITFLAKSNAELSKQIKAESASCWAITVSKSRCQCMNLVFWTTMPHRDAVCGRWMCTPNYHPSPKQLARPKHHNATSWQPRLIDWLMDWCMDELIINWWFDWDDGCYWLFECLMCTQDSFLMRFISNATQFECFEPQNRPNGGREAAAKSTQFPT